MPYDSKKAILDALAGKASSTPGDQSVPQLSLADVLLQGQPQEESAPSILDILAKKPFVEPMPGENPSASGPPVEEYTSGEFGNMATQQPSQRIIDLLSAGGRGEFVKRGASPFDPSTIPDRPSEQPLDSKALDMLTPKGGDPNLDFSPGANEFNPEEFERNRLQNERNLAMEEVKKSFAEIDASPEFDSNRWFNKMNVGAKLMTGLSLAGLAVADAMAERRGAPRRNSVAEVVDRLVAQDVMEQKENYERKLQKAKNKMNVYGILREQGLDEQSAEQIAIAHEKNTIARETNDSQLKMAALKAFSDSIKRREKMNFDAKQKDLDRRQSSINTSIRARASLDAAKIRGDQQDKTLQQMEKNATQRSIQSASGDISALDTASTMMDSFEGSWNKYQKDGDAKLYNDVTQGKLAALIRFLGEKGALAEGDVKRAIPQIPVVWSFRNEPWNVLKWIREDNPQQAGSKLSEIRGIIRKGMENLVSRVSNPNAKEMIAKRWGISESGASSLDSSFESSGE